MRIVAVADTHTFEAELTVPDGDVFVHAGDLLRGGDLDELDAVAEWLRGLPHRHKIVVPGNHDGCFQSEPGHARARLQGVHVLIDEAISLDGVRFWGSPWTPAYNDWFFNLPRGPALANRWAAIPGDTDVLITHGPPRGILDHGYRNHGVGSEGCDDLRERLGHLQVRVHLFGHVHAAGGAVQIGHTLYANVTTWECTRPPTVIDL